MIDPDEAFPIDVQEKLPDDTIYVVQRGETLAGVALKLGVKQSELKRANRMYGNKTLVAGQVLKINVPLNAQRQPEIPETAGGRANPPVQAAAAAAAAAVNDGMLVGPPTTVSAPGSSSGLLFEPPHWDGGGGGGGSDAAAEFGSGTHMAAAALAAGSRSRQASDASSSASATAAKAGASVREMFNYVRRRAAAVRNGSFYGDDTDADANAAGASAGTAAPSNHDYSNISRSSGGCVGDATGDGNATGNGNNSGGGSGSPPTTPGVPAVNEGLPPAELWGGEREDAAAAAAAAIAAGAAATAAAANVAHCAAAARDMTSLSYAAAPQRTAWEVSDDASRRSAGQALLSSSMGAGRSRGRRLTIPKRVIQSTCKLRSTTYSNGYADYAPGVARGTGASAAATAAASVPLKLPRLVSGGSTIVTHSTLARMEAAQPKHHRGYNWHLLFSSYRDGASYMTLYNRIKAEDPTFLIVEDMKGEVFGGFAASAWASGHQYYGTGESFLFKINGGRVTAETDKDGPDDNASHTSGGSGSGSGSGDGDGGGGGGGKTLMEGDMTTYGWTGMNMYLQYSDEAGIGMGGGGVEGSFGLFLGEDFLSGSTGTCDTYGNPPLCSETQFQVSQVEVWGFTTADTEMGARLERLRKTLRGKTTRPL
ncbi:unnamed protein product [Pylaiella littoralis]